MTPQYGVCGSLARPPAAIRVLVSDTGASVSGDSIFAELPQVHNSTHRRKKKRRCFICCRDFGAKYEKVFAHTGSGILCANDQFRQIAIGMLSI